MYYTATILTMNIVFVVISMKLTKSIFSAYVFYRKSSHIFKGDFQYSDSEGNKPYMRMLSATGVRNQMLNGLKK